MDQDPALKLLVLPFTQDERRSFIEANFAEDVAHLVPPVAPVAVIAPPPDPPLPQLVEEVTGFVPLLICSLCLMLRTKGEEKKAALAENDVAECVREFGMMVSRDTVTKLEDAFTLEDERASKVLVMSLAVSCSHSFKNQPRLARLVDWRFYFPEGRDLVAKPVSALAHQATVTFTVESAGQLQLHDRIQKLQALSSAFDINPSVTGFVLEGIVNGCLKFCECSKAKFNVFVKTGDLSASPLPGWPSRLKNIQYFEEKFQFEGSQPTLLLPFSWRHPLVDFVIVYQHSGCCYVVGIRITLETPKKHEKSLRFVEEGANHLKFVPRAFQDLGKHKVALLWIVPNVKKAPLAGGKPDSLQGALELEHFESVCGVPVQV